MVRMPCRREAPFEQEGGERTFSEKKINKEERGRYVPASR